MKKITVDGNEACAHIAYEFTEVAGIYPITPSSPMAEHLDEWSNNGRLNIFNDKVKVVEMQSEGGAAGMIHGSLQAGLLTTTFTASQGLLLMIPNMYKMAGEMLPCVMHVAARSLSTHALSIFGDHQDVYATRMTGFAMIASSSVEEAADMALITHLSAIKTSMPFLHFFDGFRTSHELQKINILELSDYKHLIDFNAINNFRRRAINPRKPKTIGTAQNDDIYFQATEVRNTFYDNVLENVVYYMNEINKLTKKEYKPFNYYGAKDATKIIVAMGSVCETIKETVSCLNKKGEKVGLVEVHLYRPFSSDYLLNVIPKSVKKVAVLDRTKEPGSSGEPLYLDIVNTLKDYPVSIYGGRYGLSSKNTTPRDIKAVYDFLDNKPHHNFTVGIVDDITNLSIEADHSFKIENNQNELLIYGYGSDGMVSAAKSIIKLIGNNTDNYVQGYFQYDSKKSGGVTACHLRFSKEKIKSTYYVQEPRVLVCTKESYLTNFDIIKDLKEEGIFLLNTVKTVDEIKDSLPNNIKKLLANKKAKFYIINAYAIAANAGLKNKISTVMESVIVKLLDIMDYNEAKAKMKEYAKNRFFKKGDNVVKANYDAIDNSISFMHEVPVCDDWKDLEVQNVELNDDIFNMMNRRLGNDLKTSAFIKCPNGSFPPGLSRLEKRGITDLVPKWINENCIMCNQCSFVCPHSVIRPFLLSEEEYQDAPDYVQKKCIKDGDYYYIIGISTLDCTGCGLCIKTCPGKKQEKALISYKTDEALKEKQNKISEYLFKYISLKDKYPMNTIKGTQFVMPKFEYSGACAGCGQPSYIKLLTQLFGSHLVIANATGCSSIYGGSAPSTPYTVPWSSSLFEDNAEYGYGMIIGNEVLRNRIESIMKDNIDNENKELFEKWLSNKNNFTVTNEVYEKLNYETVPNELKDLKEYIPYRTTWIIGGDGWAYDIGFSGIDQVLASSDNVNILVLDSQVYSNTGGQASKASPKGAIASFASNGKMQNKKDLARIAMSYPHAYVAQVNLGANGMQLIKAMTEAANYEGPSIIIAYTPCIAHGINGGLENSISMEKLASECGYFPIFRYNPIEEKFYLDSKNVNFDKYDEFLNSQTRYQMLKVVNPKNAENLLKQNKENAIKRYKYYQSLEEKTNENS